MRTITITVTDDESLILDLVKCEVRDDVRTLIVLQEHGGLPIMASVRTSEVAELGIGLAQEADDGNSAS